MNENDTWEKMCEGIFESNMPPYIHNKKFYEKYCQKFIKNVF